MPAFKKGQAVFVIGQWNDYTFRVRPAVVYSCGEKRMVLNTPDGSTCLGRDFLPGIGQYPGIGGALFGRVIIGTQEEAEALALSLATDWRAIHLDDMRRAIKANADQTGYVKAMRAKVAELEAATPAVIVADV